jgi:hypothetical protein
MTPPLPYLLEPFSIGILVLLTCRSIKNWNTSVISSENIYAASRTMDPHWHIIIDKELCSVRAHSGPLLAAWLIIP